MSRIIYIQHTEISLVSSALNYPFSIPTIHCIIYIIPSLHICPSSHKPTNGSTIHFKLTGPTGKEKLSLTQLLMIRKYYKICIVVTTVEFHFPPRLFIFSIIGLLFNYPYFPCPSLLVKQSFPLR